MLIDLCLLVQSVSPACAISYVSLSAPSGGLSTRHFCPCTGEVKATISELLARVVGLLRLYLFVRALHVPLYALRVLCCCESDRAIQRFKSSFEPDIERKKACRRCVQVVQIKEREACTDPFNNMFTWYFALLALTWEHALAMLHGVQ